MDAPSPTEAGRTSMTSIAGSFAVGMACSWGLVAMSSTSATFVTSNAPTVTQTPRLRATYGASKANRVQPATSSVEDSGSDRHLLGVLALGVTAAGTIARRASRSKRNQVSFGVQHSGLPTTARQATITSILTDEDYADYEEEDGSALVKKTSVLVLGATGTLGRQVVRQLLNAGYSVRCILRNRVDRPFSFLVDWGATVVEGSLVRPESLPSALVGIHTVIDCSSARPEESIQAIDWEGKKNLIQCCEKMKVQRFIFCSIKDCDRFQNVPLMAIKYATEQFLQKSGLRYTILRTTSYFQPLISAYIVNVLDDKEVWLDDGTSPGVAYIDSQDCAQMVAAALSKERTIGQTVTVTGPKVWSTKEIVGVCEKLSGRKADIKLAPTALLQLAQFASACLEWTVDVSERLRFVEVTQQQASGTVQLMSDETYRNLGLDPNQSRQLDEYISEFYRRVFKKLTKGKYEPEEGEVEREKEEAETKLKAALKQDLADALPPGQPAEVEVTLLEQRNMAERLQKFFEDKKLAEIESSANNWFGLTRTAEFINGRSAMMAFSLGLFTEWATDVSVAKQIDMIVSIFSPAGSSLM